MKIIYRYLFKKFLGPFALTFFFALFILLMQFLWKYIDDMVGKGLELTIILEFLFYTSATFVSMAVPLAVLLSSLMTFGTLGERYEIIAMKAAGISIKKLLFALSLFVFLIAYSSFWFSDNIAPKAFYKMRVLLRNIMDQKPTLSIEEGVFYHGFDNFIIRVGQKDRNNVDIYDVLLFDHTKYQGNTTFTYAKRGKMEMTDDQTYMLFYLYDGFYWDESSDNTSAGKNPLTRSTFSEQYKRIDISSFKFEKSENDFYAATNQTFSNLELKGKIDTVMISVEQNNDELMASFLSFCYYLKNDILPRDSIPPNTDITQRELEPHKKAEIIDRTLMTKNDFNTALNKNKEYNMHLYSNIAAYKTEWYKKYVLAVACMLFFFIGAPLGSIIRKGGIGVPLVITVAFFSSYFMLSVFGEKIAKGGAVPVWFGMWLSTFVLIPIGAFLTYQASVDSALLSSEEIRRKLQQLNLRKRFSKKKKNENTATHA
ncbi:MAG: LptF/LptG family permease [Bacteroidetes bacterium]|nr:LptF/LptG family permease [Bacteroidota bacterium]